jgi:hypothetical protein
MDIIRFVASQNLTLVPAAPRPVPLRIRGWEDDTFL